MASNPENNSLEGCEVLFSLSVAGVDKPLSVRVPVTVILTRPLLFEMLLSFDLLYSMMKFEMKEGKTRNLLLSGGYSPPPLALLGVPIFNLRPTAQPCFVGLRGSPPGWVS